MNSQLDTIIEFVNSSHANIILLLPIGPPGSGKTTFSKILQTKSNRNVVTISRDVVFQEFRKTNSIRKSKSLTHQKIKNTISNVENNSIIYIDTTNSNQGIRDIYINLVNPDIFKYICFQTNHLEKPIEYLLSRTIQRKHPTFPKEIEKQTEIIINILNIVDYPNDKQNSFLIQI